MARIDLPWRRISGFALIPILSLITPLLAVPVLTHRFGAEGWASVAVGQAVGLFAATSTGAAWGTMGPAQLARTPLERRPHLYRVSVISRIMLLVPATAFGMVLAHLLIGDDYNVTGMLMVPAQGCWALSPVWYFTAAGTPGRILAYDTLPKLVATLAAAGIMLVAPIAWVYPAALLTAAALCALLAHSRLSVPAPVANTNTTTQEALQYLWATRNLVVSRLATAGTSMLPLVLVAGLAPSHVPAFAAADRLRNFGSVGVNVLSTSLAGWIFINGKVVRDRRRAASLIIFGSAAATAFLVVALRRQLGSVIFSGVVDLEFVAMVGHGSALLAVGMSSILTFHFLAPQRDSNGIALAAWTGLATVVPAVALLAWTSGSTGAAFGVAIAETMVAAILWWRHRRARPDRSRAISPGV